MESFLDGKVQLHCGDCIAVMASMEETSVDAVVTDPPYHFASIVKRFGKEGSAEAKSDGATGVYKRASAGFMGKAWDGGDIAFDPDTWRAAYRVLKPGGHLLAFGAPKNFGFMQVAIADAGFEIRDVLAWLFGTGFPKSHSVSGQFTKIAAKAAELADDPAFDPDQCGVYEKHFRDCANEWEGWGTALKPAYEPIIMARKPLTGTVAANIDEYGVGGINIDACRVPHVTVNGGNLADNPHLRETINGGNGGHVFPTETERRVVTPDPQGRWPANVVHDGSDEVIDAFPETKSGLLKAGTIRNHENKIYGKGMSAAGKPATTYDQGNDSGSAARFFYSAKAKAEDRIGSKHPTIKPLALMRWLVRMVCPPNGIILDPFAGTGTTAEAAIHEGFNAILVEQDTESQDDIRRRMKLVYAGPEERQRAILTARGEVKPAHELPLFEALAA